MQDVVHSLHGAPGHPEIREVPLEEIDALDVRQVAAMAGDETIGDADAFAAADELFCQVGTDEARTTCNQV